MVKFIAGVLAIGSGLALGREGPTVQNGATERELEAIFGWSGGMPTLYTKSANRSKLAARAIGKLDRKWNIYFRTFDRRHGRKTEKANKISPLIFR